MALQEAALQAVVSMFELLFTYALHPPTLMSRPSSIHSCRLRRTRLYSRLPWRLLVSWHLSDNHHLPPGQLLQPGQLRVPPRNRGNTVPRGHMRRHRELCW